VKMHQAEEIELIISFRKNCISSTKVQKRERKIESDSLPDPISETNVKIQSNLSVSMTLSKWDSLSSVCYCTELGDIKGIHIPLSHSLQGSYQYIGLHSGLLPAAIQTAGFLF